MNNRHALQRLEACSRDVVALMNSFDHRFAEWINKHSINASCTNCVTPYCCRQPLHATALELLPLAFHLRASVVNPHLYDALLSDLHRYGTEQSTASSKEWFLTKRPCPFLHRSRCAIYALRPAICRFFVVFTPPAFCGPDSTEPYRYADTLQIHSQFVKGLHEIGEGIGLPVLVVRNNQPDLYTGPFPLLLAEVLNALETPRRFVERMHALPWHRWYEQLMGWRKERGHHELVNIRPR